MLVYWLDGCYLSEVDSYTTTHDVFPIEKLAYPNSIFDCVKRRNNSAKGF